MADPTDDVKPGAPVSGAPTPPAPSGDEGPAQAAELGMAKPGAAAQDVPEPAEVAGDAFVEKDVSQEQASAANEGEDDTTVNSQAAETAAMANAFAAESSPVIAEAGLAQVVAQATGLALLNAVNAQQNAYVTANAAVAAIVSRILALAPTDKGDRADG